MLFADIELARRVERAECALICDGTHAASRRAGGEQAFVIPFAGGAATFANEGSPLDKVVGIGFEGPIEEAALERVEARFAAVGAPVQIELSTLADSSIGPLLTSRGYVLCGFENVLARSLTHVPDHRPSPDIAIQRGDDDPGMWLDVVVDGFAAPDMQGVPSHEAFPRQMIETVIGDMASVEGFRRYLALRGGEPAGGASMRTFEGVAQLCGAATVPSHRRRGVQSRLLTHRLADAAEAGCDIAVLTAQPGSKSHQNFQRMGFELLYTRAVLVRTA
jgi:GNAT superfamily N-acetyltransferase